MPRYSRDLERGYAVATNISIQKSKEDNHFRLKTGLYMTNGQTSRKLNLFDVTNLVVGGTVGADIYIVASLGSAYLGPASLLVWLVAGAIATILALNFAKAAALVPRVGGSFAYAREAWGDFAGFMVGWPLWIAEVIKSWHVETPPFVLCGNLQKKLDQN